MAINLEPGDNILDVGCGHGISFEVFNATNKIVGLDFYEAYTASNFTFVKGDAADIPFADNHFDVAVSIGVFEHINPMSRLDKCIKEINRVACKAIVVVPSIGTIIEPHFHKMLWHLRSYKARQSLSHQHLGFEEPNNHEKLNYLADDTWLNFEGFLGWKVKNHWHIPPLIKNIFIYKR